MLVDSVKLIDGFIDDGVIETGTALPPASGSRQGQLFYLKVNPVGLYAFDGDEWVLPKSGESGSGGGGDPSSSWMGGEPSSDKQRLGLDGNSGYFGKSVNSGTTVLLYENAEGSTKTGIVKNLVICNPTDKAALLTVAIKDSLSLIALSNTIFHKAYVAAGKTVVIDLSTVVEAGKAVYARVEPGEGVSATSLNISTVGVEISFTMAAKQLAMQVLSAAYTKIYETPGNASTLMYQILAVNADVADQKLSIQIVPPAGALDTKNTVLHEVTLTPNETLMFMTVLPIPAGYRLFAKASKANSINMILDGTEN